MPQYDNRPVTVDIGLGRTGTHDELFREKLQTLDFKNMNRGYDEAIEDEVLQVPKGQSAL
jgi:hypothetical protein